MFQADRSVPRGSSLISAGEHGYLRRVDGTQGFLWTSYSDRTSVPVDGLIGVAGHPGYAGAGSDTVAVRKSGGVELRGMNDGSVRQLPLSTGSYMGTYGETVVSYAAGDTYAADLKLHRFASDGSVEVRDVALRATGGYFPNGSYTFALTATPPDGQGPAFTASGPVALWKGAPVRHDHVGTLPDGVGDLLTLNGAGEFTFHRGEAGRFSGKTTGSGWSTSALALPFGDVSGDRCNDVLIRLGTGELRAYRPGCGQPLNAAAVYTSVGTGWGQYAC